MTGYRNRRSDTITGFTLVELLVVIAIIGVLVALLLPAVQAARAAARRSQCSNNFKQVGLGMQSYHSAHNTFPPGMLYNHYDPDPGFPPEAAGHNWLSIGWSAMILPFMEEEATYSLIDDPMVFTSPGTWDASGKLISTFVCPSNLSEDGWVDCCGNGKEHIAGYPGSDWRISNVAGVMGYYPYGPNDIYPTTDKQSPMWNNQPQQKAIGNGILYNFSKNGVRNITDGTSNTLLLGEVTGGQGFDGAKNSVWVGFAWITRNLQATTLGINGKLSVPGGRDDGYRGFGITENRFVELVRDTGFSSFHVGGAHFGMADGSVQFLSENIDQTVLNSLATRAMGDVVSDTAL